MKIFIGSSEKHINIAIKLAEIIENQGHKPYLWSEQFEPTDITFERIINLCNEVDGGIFVLAPDDEIISNESTIYVPRDNVLIEAGIFYGKLGAPHVALCKTGNTKMASDWAGITYILYDSNKLFCLKNKISTWLSKIQKSIEERKMKFDNVENIPSIFSCNIFGVFQKIPILVNTLQNAI